MPTRALIRWLRESEGFDLLPKCVLDTLSESIGMHSHSVPEQIAALEETSLEEHVSCLVSPQKTQYLEITNRLKTFIREDLGIDDAALRKIAKCLAPKERKEKWRVASIVNAYRRVVMVDVCAEHVIRKGYMRPTAPERSPIETIDDLKERLCATPGMAESVLFSLAATVSNRIGRFCASEEAGTDPAMLYTAAFAFGIRPGVEATPEDIASEISRFKAAPFCAPVATQNTIDASRVTELAAQYAPVAEQIAAVVFSQASMDPAKWFLNPADPEQAIVVAAIAFGLDLTSVEAPNVHTELAKAYADSACYHGGAERVRFAPVYEWFSPACQGDFASRYSRSPEDTAGLWSSYRPAFSPLYNDWAFGNIAEREGFSIARVSGETVITGEEGAASALRKMPPTAFQSLADAIEHGTRTTRIALGSSPRAQNATTPIHLDDVDSLRFRECVTVSEGETMTVFALNELADLFRSRGVFSIPIVSGSRERILHLSRRTVGVLAAIASKAKNEPLTKAIQDVSAAHARRVEVAESASRTRELLPAIRKLLEVGMYMRGWKTSDATRDPPHPYPIESSQTTSERASEVERRVNESLAEYDAAVNSLSPDASSLLDTLPIAVFAKTADDRNEFVALSDTGGGTTISERLRIVREGDGSESVFACIRMASNLIVSSAYFYLVGFGEEAPFEIAKLSTIM